jgi:hypothetical protein
VLKDEEFSYAFEMATLPASEFDHAGHVRAGWWYLQHYPIGEAIDRFCRILRAFAAAQGATGKYHETMSIAWMLLIAERLSTARDVEWPVFAARHPELFAGDTEKAKAVYNGLLTLWKDADPDIPVLPQARVEYLRLL